MSINKMLADSYFFWEVCDERFFLFLRCNAAKACNLSEGVNRAKYSRKYISCSSNDLNIFICLCIL